MLRKFLAVSAALAMVSAALPTSASTTYNETFSFVKFQTFV